MENILIVIFYDNDLYHKYLKLREQEEFTEKLKKFLGDVKSYNNKEFGILVICSDIAYPIHLIINEVFPEKNGLAEKVLESIGMVPLAKKNNSFYISTLQITFFVRRSNYFEI